MLLVQTDLFATESCVAEAPSEEVAAVIRSRLHATLALVKSATSMPWREPLSIIREDNAFRFGKDALPPDEGARLWAEFDAEMERLYATMAQGDETSLTG
ncbi:MAG: hypothetical protein Q8Q88_04795 [Phenylobacterium sp.]|uniref:hypothetical protein n=1 Tax=Phenylobacterium sp. TaxID=1871053 RepID=UPI0027363A73|nr:hypothetical protein [Phenylobacterium sp.]MDP3746351.1 hypothetical protein [Phenylobacterium sp.]